MITVYPCLEDKDIRLTENVEDYVIEANDNVIGLRRINITTDITSIYQIGSQAELNELIATNKTGVIFYVTENFSSGYIKGCYYLIEE